MNGAKSALVETCRDVAGDALRDVWVFDRAGHEALYVRDDVERSLSDVAVAEYIDNERFGYITRDTYDELYYAEYRYTVRGFEDFLQVRLFLEGDGTRVGVLVSCDNDGPPMDIDGLHSAVEAMGDRHAVGELLPEGQPQGSLAGPKETG